MGMDGGISKRETRAAAGAIGVSVCVVSLPLSRALSLTKPAADLTNETPSLVQRVRRGEGRGAEAAAGGRMRSRKEKRAPRCNRRVCVGFLFLSLALFLSQGR